MIAATLAACLMLLLVWRDLPIARALSDRIVVPPARLLMALTAGHWLLFAAVAAAAGVVLWMGGDMIVVSALASPEILAVLAAIDAAACLDAVLVTIATAGALRGTTPRQWIARLRPRPRGRRTRTRPPARTMAANDDDPAGRWRLSA